ncbi:MAG TPA: GEVED domain-containing protein, partial [Bacteroidia bacterium]|nr:GEVED domain-containing protein [Bacteroidia bacterium]
SNKISVIGYGSISASYLDWITFQINTGGTKIWDARYNGTTGNDEQPYFLSAKANGEVFVTGKGGPLFTQPNGSSYLRMVTLKYGNTGTTQWVDSVNIYSGWGLACTLASDSSLFVLSGTNMTAFHFLDHTGTGSCGIPSGLSTTYVTDTSAKFSWSSIPGAYLYHLRYRTTSAAEWTTVSTNLAYKFIKTLSAGTSYNYAVEAICSSGPSGYSTSKTFTTSGTGYCTTAGQNTSTEYLTMVWIGGIQNVSGSNNGYGDFTNLSTPLTQGSTINGYLTATLPFGLSEYYRIWIDYNHDNDFTDAGEMAVDISSTFLGYISVNFTVPANATPGTTRMRVTMRFDSPPSPCGAYPRGETEDYTVVIGTPVAKLDNSIADNKTEKPALKVFPNPFTDKISIQLLNSNVPVTILIYDVIGKLHYTSQLTGLQNELKLSSLKSGIYFLNVMKEGRLTDAVKIIKQQTK